MAFGRRPSWTLPRTPGRRTKAAKERNRGRGREVEPRRRVYGDLKAGRRGIMVPSAGRGSSRGIGDGDDAESGGPDWVTIGAIEWAK